MDENYQTYLNRVMRMTLPDTYRSQVQHIQESPKFQHHPDHGWQTTEFPGYSVVTPCGAADHENAALYDRLTAFQAQLVQQLGENLLLPVPPKSFHMTLADLIWDSAYRHASENPDFETQLRDRIANSFKQSQPLSQNKPLRFQALGLMVMPRAIALCLAPTDEESYERALKLRRAIYQNPEVIAIGIEQQYYFTPHITLGYFGDVSAAANPDRRGQTLDELNQQWVDGQPQAFCVYRAELHKFDNMAHYYRESDWATFKF